MGRTSDAEQRLIEHATRLWYSRSYADVGVNEICEAADVRKGSFYYFFPSKRDLALAVLDSHRVEFRERIVEPVLSGEGRAIERLERISELGADYLESLEDEMGAVCGCPVGNMAVEMSTIDDVLRERLDELFAERIEFLRGLLDAAVEEGDLSDSADTRLIAEALNAYYEGMLAMSKASGEAAVVRRLAPLALGLATAAADRSRA